MMQPIVLVLLIFPEAQAPLEVSLHVEARRLSTFTSFSTCSTSSSATFWFVSRWLGYNLFHWLQICLILCLLIISNTLLLWHWFALSYLNFLLPFHSPLLSFRLLSFSLDPYKLFLSSSAASSRSISFLSFTGPQNLPW